MLNKIFPHQKLSPRLPAQSPLCTKLPSRLLENSCQRLRNNQKYDSCFWASEENSLPLKENALPLKENSGKLQTEWKNSSNGITIPDIFRRWLSRSSTVLLPLLNFTASTSSYCTAVAKQQATVNLEREVNVELWTNDGISYPTSNWWLFGEIVGGGIEARFLNAVNVEFYKPWSVLEEIKLQTPCVFN